MALRISNEVNRTEAVHGGVLAAAIPASWNGLCNKISTMIYAASLIFRRKELSSRSRAKRSRPISAATTHFGSSSPRRVNTSARSGDMWSKRRRRSQPASMAAGDPSCACANLRVSSDVSSSIVTVPPVVRPVWRLRFPLRRGTGRRNLKRSARNHPVCILER